MKSLLIHRTKISMLFVFMSLMLAYISTLMQGTVGGDAGELQYAGNLLALVHPTGQPLYVLLGKVWSEIVPFGNVAWRMNLLAAVSTASAGALTVWLIKRLWDNLFIGIIAGLTLGLSATIWGQALIADKYGFTVLLATLIIGLTLWWEKDHQKPYNDKLFYVLAFSFSLAFLHHRSLFLFVPGAAILIVWHLRSALWLNWKRSAIALAIALIPPLVMYPTVLPMLRANNVSPLMWQPNSPSDWLNFLLERHVISGEVLVFDNTSAIQQQIDIYIETLLADFTIIFPLIAVIGILFMMRRYPLGAMFLLLSYGLQAFLSANFRGNDRQFTYYLPSFVTLVYVFAYGLVVLWDSIKKPYHLAIGAVMILPVLQFAYAYPIHNENMRYGDSLVYGDDLWRQTLKSGDMGERLSRSMEDLPADAVLAGDWEQITILWYEQNVQNRRPDLNIMYPIDRYQDYLNGESPVCLARHLPLPAGWHPSNMGALVCLSDEPRTELPEKITQTGVELLTPDGNAVLEFAGYQADATSYVAGNHAPITVYWQALDVMPENYSISLQILREDWSFVSQRDIGNPVMGMYPTSSWERGEVVGDYHEIPIPLDMPAGRYLWTLVVYYQTADGEFIGLQDADGNQNILGGVFEVN